MKALVPSVGNQLREIMADLKLTPLELEDGLMLPHGSIQGVLDNTSTIGPYNINHLARRHNLSLSTMVRLKLANGCLSESPGRNRAFGRNQALALIDYMLTDPAVPMYKSIEVEDKVFALAQEIINGLTGTPPEP